MDHTEDRWEKLVDGARVRTDRYGQGKRWRGRSTDADGRNRSQALSRKGDAEKFLATITADVLRGSYVDPQRSKLPFQDYAERWLAAQTPPPSPRRTYEIYLRTRINPALGRPALGSLTPTDVRVLLRSLHEDLARSRSITYTGFCRRSCRPLSRTATSVGTRVRAQHPATGGALPSSRAACSRCRH